MPPFSQKMKKCVYMGLVYSEQSGGEPSIHTIAEQEKLSVATFSKVQLQKDVSNSPSMTPIFTAWPTC